MSATKITAFFAAVAAFLAAMLLISPQPSWAACVESQERACTTRGGTQGISTCIVNRFGKLVWGACELPSPPEPPQATFPPGSYTLSCGNSSTTNNVLTSSCKTMDGVYKSTSLSDYQSCISDIMNVDGDLRCSKGRLPPRGVYQSYCAYNWMYDGPNGGNLGAYCKSEPDSNEFIRREIILRAIGRCKQGIYFRPIFNNGKLYCADESIPDGKYLNTCREAFVSERLLYAKCPDYKYSGGRYVWTSSSPNCPGGIEVEDWGGLKCLPSPANIVPKIVEMTLRDAKVSVREAGLVIGRLDNSCFGLETVMVVKSQRPSEGTSVQSGSNVDILRCEDPSPSPQPCSGGTFYFAAQCSFQCTSVTQQACSADQAKSLVESLFPPPQCTVSAGICQSFEVATVCGLRCTSESQYAIDAGTAVEIVRQRSSSQCKVRLGSC